MFRRSKSIRELYKEAKGFDLVITNDPALATGLNRLVDRPRIGTFALTPRQLASRYGTLMSDKLFTVAEIVADVAQKLKLPLRIVHPVVEKIFEIWKNIGILENSELFLTREEFELAKIVREYPTIEKYMEEFDENFIESDRIAVAGVEIFNLLDQMVIPRTGLYSTIGLFTDEFHFPIDKTYLYPSSNDMINGLAECITSENENSVAVVMNFASPFLPIIKSRLKRNGINIIEKGYLSQDSSTKDFLKILGLSFMSKELLVSDIRQLSEVFAINILSVFDQWQFESYVKSHRDDVSAHMILETFKKLEGIKYSEAIELLESRTSLKLRDEFLDVIKMLGLGGRKLNEDNFNDLIYFIKFIDVDLDRCDDGVLFANSQNSVHINRDIVIYLGMDASWTKRISDLNYIDRKEEEKKNLEKFQILLNQGSQRFYFSHAVTNGERTLPCHYFNILVNRSIKDFDAAEFGKVNPVLATSQQITFPENETSVRAAIKIEEISQSGLNNYYSCPRKFAYSILIKSPETPALKRGQILHYFAEFAFDYPDFCEERFEAILEKLLGEFESFRVDKESESDRSVFRIAMRQILDFAKSVQGERRKYTRNDLSGNFLYREFRMTKLYDNTEFFFKNIAPGIRGRVDLAIDGKIFDYKISAKKTVGSYVNNSVMGILRKKKLTEANFQTPMYFIYLLKEYAQASDHEFTYLFPIGDRHKIVNEGSAEMPSSTIYYVPQDMTEYLAGEEFYEKICGRSKAAMALGAEKWKELVLEFAERIRAGDDVCEDVTGRFRKIITDDMNLGPSDFRRKSLDTFEKNDIVPVGKAFSKVRTPHMQPGMLFKDDIEQMKEYISNVLEEIGAFLGSDFPYRPAFEKRKVCSQCDFLGICTGNKLWEGSGEAIDENGSRES